MTSQKKIYAVDLFCGVGGLTRGLQDAGISVRAGFDNDPTCQTAYEHNNKKTEFINADIREVTPDMINRHYKGADVKVLVGCAPCQPFSAHTKKNREWKDSADNRYSLLLEVVRLVKACQPDIISIENVPGLEKEKIYSDFVKKLEDLGYPNNTQIVFCPEYGIPQTRKRLVYLSSRRGEINLIPPTHAKKEKWLTVADCIKGLPPITHGGRSKKDLYHSAPRLTDINLKRIQQSKQGGSWRDWDKKLISPCQKKATYLAPYGRMKWNAPAPTITTQFCCYSTGRFGHPTQHRTISLREAALLQTFPKSYQFHDKSKPLVSTQIARHIGNAVPVKLGQAIGKSMRRHANEQ